MENYVFVDFETAVLNNDLSIEKTIKNISKNQKWNSEISLESLPYNSKTLSVLKENYLSHLQQIFILYEKKNEDYAKRFINDFENIFNNIKLLEKSENTLNQILNITKDFDFITGSLWDFKIIRKAKASSMIGNWINFVIHFIISNSDKDSRNLYFEGFFETFFNYFQILVPIFSIWPAWMEVNNEILNLSKMKGCFVSTMGFSSFFLLLRTLLILDRERSFIEKNLTAVCDTDLIISSNKIRTAFLVLMVFFIFGLKGFFHSIIGGFMGIAISLFFVSIAFSAFWRKWTSFIVFNIIFNIIMNPIFSKKLFGF